MTSPFVLLRVLLVLALVLNGIGSAVAGVHAHGHADRDLVEAMAMDAGAPCHEQAPAPRPDADPEGCCDGARCDCACTQAGAMLAALDVSAPTPPAVVLAMHGLASGHRAPTLAHPIRPPIG